ncbi:hypothetical protein DFJ73DRAFT_811322 [Zopfochytrium polystomum]|nr:hypothetical protein DFJ73DRAFT_811322 [Zopfochytrium polystomum]
MVNFQQQSVKLPDPHSRAWGSSWLSSSFPRLKTLRRLMASIVLGAFLWQSFKRNESSSKLEEVLQSGETSVKNMTIHLVTQWYWPSNRQRAAEFVFTLAKNVNSTDIDFIHLLQPVSPRLPPNPLNHVLQRYFAPSTVLDPYFPMERFLRKVRVDQAKFQGRLRIGDALALASTFPGRPTKPMLKRRMHGRGSKANYRRGVEKPSTVVVLANLDIYFDSTLSLLGTSMDSDLSPFTSFFLSRWESPTLPAPVTDSRLPDQCGPAFIGSHDAFIFVPPLPDALVDRTTELEIGAWGVEARLLWEFEQVGIEGRNPCLDIKAWHVHGGRRNSSQSLNQTAAKDVEWERVRAEALGLTVEETDFGEGERRDDGEEGDSRVEFGEEDSRGDGGRRAMPVVNTGGRSSIAFPDGLVRTRPRLVDELWGAGGRWKR